MKVKLYSVPYCATGALIERYMNLNNIEHELIKCRDKDVLQEVSGLSVSPVLDVDGFIKPVTIGSAMLMIEDGKACEERRCSLC